MSWHTAGLLLAVYTALCGVAVGYYGWHWLPFAAWGLYLQIRHARLR